MWLFVLSGDRPYKGSHQDGDDDITCCAVLCCLGHLYCISCDLFIVVKRRSNIEKDMEGYRKHSVSGDNRACSRFEPNLKWQNFNLELLLGYSNQ